MRHPGAESTESLSQDEPRGGHVILKMSKIKERILKVAIGKQLVTQEGSLIRL